jgi:protein-S-isoprenylcysteine O-methyltransferase Ste14
MSENRSKLMSKEERRLIVDWIWQTSLFLVVFTITLFLIAGDWRWLWGWMIVLLLTLFLAAHPLLLVPRNPALLAERERGLRVQGTKKWDRWMVMVASLFWSGSWLLAALDHRLGWPPEFPPFLHWLGFLGTAAGMALFLWALSANAFFAEGVRIQSERGHKVCDSGPYRFVRHPGYLGDIISGLCAPLLLGSLWAFIPALLSTFAFVLRTYWEDRTLLQELEGYREYAEWVRWRLFLRVW